MDPTQAVDAKTSRLTENKRRYRARQKEYVSDLERRLAEARGQGIQATREVQLAARRVVLENGRLRGLLQLAGFSDENIDVWAGRGTSGENENRADCAILREIEQQARRCATFTVNQNRAMETEGTSSSNKNPSEGGTGQAGHISESTGMPQSTEEPLVTRSDSPSQSDPNAAAVARRASPTQAESQTGHGRRLPPCKLLSRIAENPGADITQVLVPPSSADSRQDAVCLGGDVECGRAYEILMRHATSDEKLDDIARVLESGCSANGEGGCAVKTKVIWQALDGMCG